MQLDVAYAPGLVRALLCAYAFGIQVVVALAGEFLGASGRNATLDAAYCMSQEVHAHSSVAKCGTIVSRHHLFKQHHSGLANHGGHRHTIGKQGALEPLHACRA